MRPRKTLPKPPSPQDELTKIKQEYKYLQKDLSDLEQENDTLVRAMDNALANLKNLHKAIKYPEVQHVIKKFTALLKEIGYIKEE